jgi:hypothetical protein
MGAQLETKVYPYSLGRSWVAALWADEVLESRRQHGCEDSGKIGVLGIDVSEWLDESCRSHLAAKDKFDTFETDGLARAVSFMDADSVKRWMIGGWCNE